MRKDGKINILLICPVYAPHVGGGGQYFPLLVKELLKSGVVNKIIVVTEAHPGRAVVSQEDSATIFRILPQRDTLENKSKLYSIGSFLWTYSLFYIAVPYLTARHRISIIHYTRYLRRAFYFLLYSLSKLFHTRTVLDMRATVENDVVLKNLFGYHCVISNSEAVYRQVQDAGIDQERHMLVENPMYFPRVYTEDELWRVLGNLSPAIKRPYLTFIGQLLERKSIFEVLDAFKEFSRRYPEYILVIAGRNMLGVKVIKRIDRMEGVIYLGPVGHDHAVALMQGCELVLQPSKIEGIPRVSLEALSLGKKVLLPPCVPEFVRACPEFCPEEITPESLCICIEKILSLHRLPFYDRTTHDPKGAINKVLFAYQNTQKIKV